MLNKQTCHIGEVNGVKIYGFPMEVTDQQGLQFCLENLKAVSLIIMQIQMEDE